MTNKSIEKIWLICLWLASLALAGCFHVPDEDWLLSSDKAETWDVKNDEVDEAINSLIDWVNMVSSKRDEMKNNESDEINTWGSEENSTEVEDESIDNEDIAENEEINIEETGNEEDENQEIEEDIISEE